MGVNGGIRPNARNVGFMSDQIPGGPEGQNQWQVIGISREQWKLVAAALTFGGNAGSGSRTTSTCPTARWRSQTAS